MTTITARQFATVKRTAMNIYPLVNKIEQKRAEITKLNEEVEDLTNQISSWEGGVKAMTDGYTSSELVERNVITLTNEDGSIKLDKNGQPMKQTKWVASDNITWNDDKKVYEIKPQCVISKENCDNECCDCQNADCESQLPLNVLE